MAKQNDGQSEQLRLVHSRVPTNPIATIASTKKLSPNQLVPSEFGSFEPYVDEKVVARFLSMEPRQVLELAREGSITSHPRGRTRMTWRFRISEIAADMEALKKPARGKMPQAVPGTKERNQLG